MNLAERLSDFAHGLAFSDIDADTIADAKARIVDSLGCAIGAFGAEPVAIARRYAESSAGGGSTVLGTKTRVSPETATFVNGVMIRYFDFNDTYLSKEPAHPSDNLGAVLSVGEELHSTGEELLTALVVAYEVQCRLCDAADIRHRGWDHVCYGLVSSALAAGKLMGLNRRELTQAVNISLNGHIAMRQVRAGELSMWKGASFANAARNAVFAARLAREGMSGPSPIFEGEMGFFRQVSGEFVLRPEKFGGRRRRFKLSDTYIKFYPAEYHAQTAVAAALKIRERLRAGDEIKSVEVRTHEAGFTILGKDPEKWSPTTKETADHSLPYMVGAALLDGKLDNASYSVKRMRDGGLLRFLQRVTVIEDPRLTSLYPASGMGNRVTVRTASGGEFAEEVLIPRGHPLNPMDRDEVEGKFEALTRRYLQRRQREKVLERVWEAEKIRDVSTIPPMLKAKGR